MAIINVNAGGDLQAALNSAVGGDIVQTEAGATFEGNYTLPIHSGSSYVTLRSAGILPGNTTRVTPETAANFTKFKALSGGLSAITALPGSMFWNLTGIECLFNPGGFGEVISFGDGRTNQTTLDACPRFVVIDRVYIHNSFGLDQQKRAIGLNCRDCGVINSYIKGVKLVGTDSQAIAAFNGPGPFQINNNFLEAASENVLFGGDDSANSAMMPSNITMVGNYLTKDLDWRAIGTYNVKTLLEFKVGINANVNGNILENCWVEAQPQGIAIQITVRNQNGLDPDGGAPWSEIRNVSLTNNIIRNAGGGVNYSGADVRDDGTVVPTQGLSGCTLRDNVFYNITSANGSGRCIQFGNGGNNYVTDHNTFINSQGGGSVAIYLIDGIVNGWIFTNNIYVDNGLGVFGDQGQQLGTATMERQAPGYTFLKNVMITCPFPNLYPDGNYSPTSIDAVGFVNPALNNYQLSSASPYLTASTIGDNIGARFSTVVVPPPPVTPPPITPPPDPPPPPPPNPPPDDPHPPGAFGGSSGLYAMVANRVNDQIYLDYTTNTKILRAKPLPSASLYLAGDE